jgi:hypothetical protein
MLLLQTVWMVMLRLEVPSQVDPNRQVALSHPAALSRQVALSHPAAPRVAAQTLEALSQAVPNLAVPRVVAQNLEVPTLAAPRVVVPSRQVAQSQLPVLLFQMHSLSQV